MKTTQLGRVVQQVLAAGIAAALFAGCGFPGGLSLPVTPGPTPSATSSLPHPTAEPPPAKTLIVCLRQEPTSLYLYADTNREADAVLAAIYDGPVDLRGFQYQPVILKKIPSLKDGDARLESVAVNTGDVYLNPVTLQPANLKVGLPYLPSGCQTPDCQQKYAGGQVQMDRMLVEFTLLPGLRWSDGGPLTAADSVYSFTLDGDKDTPSTKYLVDRTAAYEAVDQATVRWTGVPGFLDSEFAANFWSPLPQHVLQRFTAAQLPTANEAARIPIGWGPYVIKEWQPGREIVLEKNPAYFRAAEGLPAFDVLLYRFVGSDVKAGIQQLLTGECDVLDESVLTASSGGVGLQPDTLKSLMDLQQAGKLRVASAAGFLVERLDFGLASRDPQRLSLFGDVRTRRGVAACIDRKKLANDTYAGLAQAAQSFVPPGHPLLDSSLTSSSYDTVAGKELLTQAGWQPAPDGAGTRTAAGVKGVPDGTPLSFDLTVGDNGLEQATADAIAGQLGQCGVQIKVGPLPAAQITEPWPTGPVFGRAFDAVAWAWPALATVPCEMFQGGEIASNANRYGVNASGFQDASYDKACQQLLLGLPDTDAYGQAAISVQQIVDDQLPAIPLLVRPRLAAYAKTVCGVDPDPTAASVLWDLERYQPGDACKGG
jgi:peptide/nickel transport system substrate-binding protein